MASTLDAPVRLSAIDCALRGAAILRVQGWLLVGARLLRNLVLLALIAASLAPPILALGLDLWLDLPSKFAHLQDLDGLLEGLSALADRLAWSPQWVVALVAMLLLWLLAGYVYCYFQAGIYGVLAAADRQSEGSPPLRWRDFARLGCAGLGRFFALANLFGLFLGAVLLLALLGVGAVASAAQIWGVLGALGVGCAGLVPILLLLWLCGVWFELACANLAREEGAGAWPATRDSWEILRRRVGAVALLLVLFAAASMLIWLALFPLSALVSFSTNGRWLVAFAGQTLLQLVAALPGAALQTAMAGSWVALVRSEAIGA